MDLFLAAKQLSFCPHQETFPCVKRHVRDHEMTTNEDSVQPVKDEEVPQPTTATTEDSGSKSHKGSQTHLNSPEIGQIYPQGSNISVGKSHMYQTSGTGMKLVTWDEFIHYTSFHGFRFVFDKSSFHIRR